MGGNSTRVWRAIRPDKKHPCWREFVRPWNREAWLLVNPPEASFCGDCGASLGTGSAAGDGRPSPRSAAQPQRPTTLIQPEVADASEVPDGERKTVTALFADIKGSMELIRDRT